MFDVTWLEARLPITPPNREPARDLLSQIRLRVPSTTPLPRHRSLGSISGAGSHSRVGCGRGPSGIRPRGSKQLLSE
jgi:hypothetical protein